MSLDHTILEPLDDKDWTIVDEADEAFMDHKFDRVRELYLEARPRAKPLIALLLDTEAMLFVSRPGFDERKVRAYLAAQMEGDEIGMRRAYRTASAITRAEIDSMEQILR